MTQKGGEIKGTASTRHLHPQPLCISLFACAFAHQGRRVLTRTVGEERKRARSWQLKQTGSPRKTETQVSSETGNMRQQFIPRPWPMAQKK